MRNCALGVVVLLATLPYAAADDATLKSAKDVLAKYQDAIVTVRLVVKTGPLDSQIEVAGTVLTPEGLTVVSDSGSNFASLLGEDGGRSETSDVKLLLKDGRELPASFVLRDKDLDLAFVLPKEKNLKLAHVKLDKVPVPQVLDELIFLHRLGKTLNREVSVGLGHVGAVVKKPRTLIVPATQTGMQNLGCPVFDKAGRAVGVVVMRRATGGDRGAVISFAGRPLVILTGEDVQQVAGQVGKQDESK